MKRFLCGLIIGIMICSFSIVIAQEFIATTATFPILVNGENLESDKPAVVINGSTYLPLRVLGDALGVKVNWNDAKKQVEIGEAKLPASKFSRSNPAPIGTKQVVTVDNLIEKYTAEVTIKEVLRGDNAWSMIEKANMFNDKPKEGYDYILAKIDFKLLDINDDKSLSVYQSMFELYSLDFKKYDSAMVVPPEPKLQSDLYKGASIEGWAVYQVKFEDAKPTLAFGQKYDGTGGVWFKAY